MLGGKYEVFILANGNSSIGMGHIFRSLMLTKELREKGVLVTYISYDNDIPANKEILKFARLIELESHEKFFESSTWLLNAIFNNKLEDSRVLLYVDSDESLFYQPLFQKEIINHGVKLMFATLYSDYHYYAHLVLNQNILALSQDYDCEKYTKCLLGPRYFLWPKKASNMIVKSGVSINGGVDLFVNFGNADPNDITGKLLDVIISNISLFKSVVVVVGGLYQDLNSLKSKISESDAREKISLHHNVTNMYDLMKQCNLGICSMGLTFWELTYQNIPSLVFSGSDRERAVCDFVSDEGYAFKVGDYSDKDWFNLWTGRIFRFISEKRFLSLKTAELKSQININGTQLVVDEMMSILKHI